MDCSLNLILRLKWEQNIPYHTMRNFGGMAPRSDREYYTLRLEIQQEKLQSLLCILSQQHLVVK